MDTDLYGHLDRLEAKLDDIRSNTRTTWRELLLAGLLRGSGIIIGSVLTIALAGWGLTILGVVPGADEIAEYLSQLFEEAGNGV